jgi:hypothetical protein
MYTGPTLLPEAALSPEVIWACLFRGACTSKACILLGVHLTGLHLIGAHISQNVHLRCLYLIGVHNEWVNH